MVKTVTEQHGLLATFMPKPFAHLTGNGAHYHTSLWNTQHQTNLFLAPHAPNGLSQLAYWFMGGLLAHAHALAAVTNPLVNSYKRLMRGTPRSGATWISMLSMVPGIARSDSTRATSRVPLLTVVAPV